MALIGKIREKSWLLILIIGLALLAFILSDYKSIMGAYSDEYGLGTVYGTKVNAQKYDAAVQRFEQQGRMQAQQQQKEFTQQDQENANEQAWNFVVDNEILTKEYENLGIEVGEAEFKAYLFGNDGFSVLPEIAQGFTDSATGVLNKKSLEARIKEMSTSKNADVKKQWDELKQQPVWTPVLCYHEAWGPVPPAPLRPVHAIHVRSWPINTAAADVLAGPLNHSAALLLTYTGRQREWLGRGRARVQLRAWPGA